MLSSTKKPHLQNHYLRALRKADIKYQIQGDKVTVRYHGRHFCIRFVSNTEVIFFPIPYEGYSITVHTNIPQRINSKLFRFGFVPEAFLLRFSY